ncbi:hypothetical protein CAMGR0001_1158 [Campylobacter gracilis RM3268]|uniref:Uncharacterized protein n=1 Tax=Campylobacter gracilis RM3268 TaxID=553220 RepID=C8PIV9_9BACT|nr:hypothetical protein CAMGR0001_1158 [Campylobacter gracilis RM3268]
MFFRLCRRAKQCPNAAIKDKILIFHPRALKFHGCMPRC